MAQMGQIPMMVMMRLMRVARWGTHVLTVVKTLVTR
ncbi:hypothetical protein Hamer_G010057 [Homarus americanus]|uniref:Uncharacterized protein n=1 Tax=Homarus americanus TaxID=6706 RepID=A0A8J5MMS4_HOMAM|nr:hypothetical protein Hamer_G010057 [Homarus americanus]